MITRGQALLLICYDFSFRKISRKMEMFKFIELLLNSTQEQELKESLLQKYMERLTENEHSAE